MGMTNTLNTARATLARNFAQLLRANGFRSEDALAKKAGIAQKTANNILNIRGDPTLKTLVKVADALRVEPWELLHDGQASQAAATSPETFARLVIALSAMEDEQLQRVLDSLPPAQ